MITVLVMFWGIFSKMANSDVTGNTPNFAVRLNSYNSKEGRLEIYYSGTWGTVCDDLFTDNSATVACASLGYGYGVVIGNRYGAGEGPIWLDDVTCTGTENGIEQCAHRQWGVHNCSHNDDVSISCGCGSRYFSGPTGSISSPNYPMAYANNLTCYNYISATSGQTIVITFSALNTEKCCDFVTITCESGNPFKSPSYSGSELPSVLIISSCQLVNVSFRTDLSVTFSGFSLTYNFTSEIVIGGITAKPSNAFPPTNRYHTVIFNCTTSTKYLPWWIINGKSSGNYTITNSTCGVTTSAPYSYWFFTETLGPGSCNLIMVAPGSQLYLLAGSFICTDSTLASASALMLPINLGLYVTKGMNTPSTTTDIIRDEEVRISCTPSFADQNSSPRVFTYTIYSGGPVVRVSILRIFWTSQGDYVSGINAFNASSYVAVKATNGFIPPYTCNIVCEFIPNINNISGNYSIKISESTEPIKVLYWPTEENMTISGHNNGQIGYRGFLYCYVPSNPPATYQWIDEINGYITNSSTITIAHGGKYTCNASNFIRGQHYQQSKSISVEVLEDDTHWLKILAIILGSLLGVALLIIIILAILLIRKHRQQKTNTTADIGHVKHVHEQELQQRGRSNRYETGIENPIADVEEDYENLDASQRPLPTILPIYQELDNRN